MSDFPDEHARRSYELYEAIVVSHREGAILKWMIGVETGSSDAVCNRIDRCTL